MGLIARHLEAEGIPTLSMSSAYSITRSVNPPRAAYLDYPLGHTTGKPNDPAEQRAIMVDALRLLERIEEPGTLETLNYNWADDDDWKDRAMRPQSTGDGHDDTRMERFDTPLYHNDDDEAAAEAALAGDGCQTCVWLE